MQRLSIDLFLTITTLLPRNTMQRFFGYSHPKKNEGILLTKKRHTAKNGVWILDALAVPKKFIVSSGIGGMKDFSF